MNVTRTLEALYHFWGCSKPIFFIIKIANEIIKEQHYYARFDDITQLLRAVRKKIIEKKVFDFTKHRWVKMI